MNSLNRSKISMKLTLGLVLYQTFLFAMLPTFASASEINVDVTPQSHFAQVLPNENSSYIIEINNNANTPLLATAELVEFSTDKYGWPNLESELNNNFVHIQQVDYGNTNKTTINWHEEFALPANSTTQVKLGISPQKNIEEREYHTTVLFRVKPDSSLITMQDSSSGQAELIIGSNLIVLVGNQQSNPSWLRIANLNTNYILDSLQPMTAEVELENIGAAAVLPAGKLQVFNWQNQEIHSAEINPDVVLAHSRRLARFKTNLDNEKNDNNQHIFTFDNGFLLGIYHITVTLTDSSQNNTIVTQVTKTIIAIPYKALIILLGSLIVFVILKLWQKRTRHLAKY